MIFHLWQATCDHCGKLDEATYKGKLRTEGWIITAVKLAFCSKKCYADYRIKLQDKKLAEAKNEQKGA
jgi:hypothetical protein